MEARNRIQCRGGNEMSDDSDAINLVRLAAIVEGIRRCDYQQDVDLSLRPPGTNNGVRI
jgi:hypothetical protein